MDVTDYACHSKFCGGDHASSWATANVTTDSAGNPVDVFAWSTDNWAPYGEYLLGCLDFEHCAIEALHNNWYNISSLESGCEIGGFHLQDYEVLSIPLKDYFDDYLPEDTKTILGIDLC